MSTPEVNAKKDPSTSGLGLLMGRLRGSILTPGVLDAFICPESPTYLDHIAVFTFSQHAQASELPSSPIFSDIWPTNGALG